MRTNICYINFCLGYINVPALDVKLFAKFCMFINIKCCLFLTVLILVTATFVNHKGFFKSTVLDFLLVAIDSNGYSE